jgi:MFS family permease
VLIAVAPDIAVLALAIYLLRLFGQGMMPEIAFTKLDVGSLRTGPAMALITQGQQVGSAILPAAVVGITQLGGSWRAGWFVSAAAVVLLGLPAIVSLVRVERVPHSHEAKVARVRTGRDWTRGVVIRDPIFYLLLAAPWQGGRARPAFRRGASFSAALAASGLDLEPHRGPCRKRSPRSCARKAPTLQSAPISTAL